MNRPPRVSLLISSLNCGGAERQACVLANGLAQLGHSVSLLAFNAGGPFRHDLSSSVTLRCLERRGRFDLFRLTNRLRSAIAEEHPDVLYTLMPGANLAGCLGELCAPKLKLVWGLRASYIEMHHYDWAARLSYWLESRLSGLPDLVIANSEAGRLWAESRGFPKDGKVIVIPNGVDVRRFRFDPASGQRIRAEWGIPPEMKLIGIVGRLDPMKDHWTFLEAAAMLATSYPGLQFVVVGGGPHHYAARLNARARDLGLSGRIIWAGERDDLPAIYNALDLLVSSSIGEGFPNALAEAMASGTACVATDVGDVRVLLGNEGTVVPPRDSNALARAILAALDGIASDRRNPRANLRQRIVDNFSAETLARRTSEALQELSS